MARVEAPALRARYLMAYRVHVARLASGREEDLSEEADSVVFIDAVTALEIHGLHEMTKVWLEAQK